MVKISLYWPWALTTSRMLLVDLDSFKTTMASLCLSILSLFSLFYLSLCVPSQNEGGNHTSGFWVIWLKVFWPKQFGEKELDNTVMWLRRTHFCLS